MKKLVLAGLVAASVLVGNLSAAGKQFTNIKSENEAIFACFNESDALPFIVAFAVDNNKVAQEYLDQDKCMIFNNSQQATFELLDTKKIPVGSSKIDMLHVKLLSLNGKDFSNQEAKFYFADMTKKYAEKLKK